jgi:pimeloyl-ACP methyl ester carboxylesterase
MRLAETADRPRETVVDVRGLPTFVREAGTGPPLLFLHGPEEPGWPPALARLAREFRVVAPDHPGMGRTPLGDDLEGMDDLVYHYLDLMDALGLGDVTLVGVSFGGWIAAELAVSHSRRLSRLVLVSAAGLRLDGRDLPELYFITDHQKLELLLADPKRAELLFPAAADPEAVERRLTQWATLARFTWQPYWHNPKLPARLHRITAPALILRGADDRFIPPSHAKAFAQRIPGATLGTIPDAGHLPHLEQPDRFCEAIAGFVTGPSPARA